MHSFILRIPSKLNVNKITEQYTKCTYELLIFLFQVRVVTLFIHKYPPPSGCRSLIDNLNCFCPFKNIPSHLSKKIPIPTPIWQYFFFTCVKCSNWIFVRYTMGPWMNNFKQIHCTQLFTRQIEKKSSLERWNLTLPKQYSYTGWPVIYGRVFLVPLEK